MLLTWMVELIKAQFLVVCNMLNFKCDIEKYNYLTTHETSHTKKPRVISINCCKKIKIKIKKSKTKERAHLFIPFIFRDFIQIKFGIHHAPKTWRNILNVVLKDSLTFFFFPNTGILGDLWQFYSLTSTKLCHDV